MIKKINLFNFLIHFFNSKLKRIKFTIDLFIINQIINNNSIDRMGFKLTAKILLLVLTLSMTMALHQRTP